MLLSSYSQYVTGWSLLAVIALVASVISSMIEVAGKHPLEAAILAIVIGMVLSNSSTIPRSCESGVKAFEKPLALGIVLLGASFNYYQFFEQGFALLLIVVGTMLTGLIAIVLFAYFLRLPPKLALLLGLGTTICGGTAIAITAPLMKASEEETSYAIGVIALWGIAALVLYPTIAQSLGVSDEVFGIFAGTAIHSTPQVVGAGFMFSEVAGKTATGVKLLRNCFIAPLAFGVALWFTPASAEGTSENRMNAKYSVAKALPWFLFGYFLMAFLYSEELLPDGFSAQAVYVGKFLILIGMAGVGANTRLNAFKKLGFTPLLAGLFGSIIVAMTSAILIIQLYHQ